MEVKIGLAKTAKYATEVCGDTCDVVERPHGGISAIIAVGQGNGLAAHHTSSWVVNKAVQLISDGARDGAVARAVHDYLYAMKDKKVSCTLTVVSADLDTETAVISRNSNCPVIIKTDEYESVYDENVEPIGVNRHMKPLMYEVPLTPGMLIVSYTDGIAHAGKKRSGHPADFNKILEIVRKNGAEDVSFIAKSIMDYALELDAEKASDDMTVLVMGITDGSPSSPKIEQLEVTYPY
ncbi:MAG: serine/threonine-protein phosphatase [Selenomonas sp.]|nr:serine/threonine-protein phosphatase [Selenomonas sp.]